VADGEPCLEDASDVVTFPFPSATESTIAQCTACHAACRLRRGQPFWRAGVGLERGSEGGRKVCERDALAAGFSPDFGFDRRRPGIL